LGIHHALYVEVMCVIIAIEYVQLKSFEKFWLECDFSFLCEAFSYAHIIPWILKCGWCKCIRICDAKDFKVIHIFRNGNNCAKRLNNLGMKK